MAVYNTPGPASDQFFAPESMYRRLIRLPPRVQAPAPTPKPTDQEKPITFKPDTDKPDKPINTDSGAGTTAFRPMPYVRGALAFGNIAYPGQVGRQHPIQPEAPVAAGHVNAIPNALGAPAQPKAIPLVPKQFKSIAGATPRKP